MDDEQIAFTMCTGLAGRLYLSGRLDGMHPRQRQLVREGVDLARSWSDDLLRATPGWPLGLPSWTAPWVASGLRAANETLVAVWWRGNGPREGLLDLPAGPIEIAYPSTPAHPWRIARQADGTTRIQVADDQPQARILRIAHPMNDLPLTH